jgi:hypothetical protein
MMMMTLRLRMMMTLRLRMMMMEIRNPAATHDDDPPAAHETFCFFKKNLGSNNST